MKLTPTILREIYTSSTLENCIKFATPLNNAMASFNINTPMRISAFLAQVGHESGQLKYVEENLNYSAEGLRAVFSKYFPTPADAMSYAHMPEKIANRVYGLRLGNSSESSGDGWRFRGRGLIQITGKENYIAVSAGLGVDFIITPDRLVTPEYAALSAAWFWQSRGLNAIADRLGGADDITIFRKITKIINGGTNGQDDREAIYSRAKRVIV